MNKKDTLYIPNDNETKRLLVDRIAELEKLQLNSPPRTVESIQRTLDISENLLVRMMGDY